MSESVPMKRTPLRLLILWNQQPRHASDVAFGEGADPSTITAMTHIERTVARIAVALRARRCQVVSVNAEDDIERIAAALVVERPAVVLNLIDEIYGDFTQHAAVAAYLDLFAYPYLGADPLCLAICQDRARTRLVLADAEIPVPAFATIRDINAIPDTSSLRAPMIVTQAYDDLYEDEGMTRPIHEHAHLVERAAELSREFDFPFLIEEWLGSRRVHAIVMGAYPFDVLPLVEAWHEPDAEAGAGEAHDDADTGEFAPVAADDGDDADATADEDVAAGDVDESEAEDEADEAESEADEEADADAGDEAEGGEAEDGSTDGVGEEDEDEDDDDDLDEITLQSERMYATAFAGSRLPADEAASSGSHAAREAGDVTGEPAGVAAHGLALAQLEPDTADRVRQLARRAFRAMGCRDLAQIDFHFDDDDLPYVVDVRPYVSLGEGTPFAVAAAHTHRGYEGTIAELVRIVSRRVRVAEGSELGEPEQGEGNGGAAAGDGLQLLRSQSDAASE